jgi:DNA polymerase-1
LPADAAMISTVHDELLFEVPDTAVEAAQTLVRERMEGVVELAVPLTVDIGSGKSWKAAKG